MRDIGSFLVCLLMVGSPLAVAEGAGEAGGRVEGLRCESLCNPSGIDVLKPRLSWLLRSGERGQRQSAYRVLVASAAERLSGEQGDLWDSGRVESDASCGVVYAGKPLASRGSCFWKVRVWDRDGRPSPWSDVAFWSMGLLTEGDWRGRWICPGRGVPTSGGAAAQQAAKVAPSPWLRKAFVLEAEPEEALAYVNVVGYYELYVNGRKAGSDVLSPAVSDYRARSFYVTYDIRPLLRKGRNCVGIWLGRGGYAPDRAGVRPHGPAVRFQCDIVAGGRGVPVVTDESWKWSGSPYVTLGPWQWDQYGGERYDARLDNPGWSSADYDDGSWVGVEVIPSVGGRAQRQLCPLNRIGKRMPAVACKDLGGGSYEVDFGANLSGWMRMRMPPLAAGQRVGIHYADLRYASPVPEGMPKGVDRHGSDETFTTPQGKFRYQTFHQADEFISGGRGGEEFCSKFNYHGFRYAVIEGLPTAPRVEDMGALLIESDLEPVGSFSCSNELFNRIYALNLWTIRCLNLGGYMVDCPHRERMGYGDGQVSAETCLMNFRMPNFYAKWLGDWRDGQDPNTGDLPHVAPFNPGGGGPGWGGLLAALAWRTYLYCGDRRVLEDCYGSMRRYVDFLESRCKDGILRAYGGQWDFIGDWVPPDRGMDTTNWPPARANELFNNCYRVYLWELLEKSAAALGREEEARRCRAQLERVRPLIHREFYDAGKHTYVLDEQAYQCLPLLTGVVPPSEREAVLRKLEEGILVQRRGHLDAGMLGTYFLLQYLPTVGRDDLLFAIANQKTYPGWGHMLEQGATTIWEQWNGYYSQIHSCFTSIGGWFQNGLAGIQPDAAEPGFKNVIIRPAVVGDLTWVKCGHQSVRGEVVSNWRREGGKFTLEVTIPPGATATIYVPTKDAESVTESGRAWREARCVKFLRSENGRAVFAVGSGKYKFAAAL